MRHLNWTLAGLMLGMLLAACTGQSPREEPEIDRTAIAPPPQTAGQGRPERKAQEQIVVTDSRLTRQQLARAASPAGLHALRMPSEPLSRENYAHREENGVLLAAEHPVSTFSIDVDTGSYANVRRWLEDGRLPPQDAVRVEEMINYFGYDYAAPDSRERPFAVHTELAAAPWNEDALLLQIGLKGYEVPRESRPPANLVFLIDVSGSMQSPDKLDLLKGALKLLARQLGPGDRVSMVVYAGATGMVLPPTAGDREGEIIAAVDGLSAGGSTNGGAGIRLAYSLARQAYIRDGINRVLLATDGDFNVGTVNFEELVDLVERERAGGITLTTLGFGTGNYNDHLLEQLADKGNGNYAYIDSITEARKVLVEQMASTLQVIAGDVKIQIEFNPEVVAEYQLIGYENRLLDREDFHNDKVDAGEIGAGHTVTALYEIVLRGSDARRVDPLRYGERNADRPHGDELAWLKLRYKLPGHDRSTLLEQPVHLSDQQARPGDDFRFAAAVAAFGQKLRGGEHLGDFGYADIRTLADRARGSDPHGWRGEFLGLVELADALHRGGTPQAGR